MTDLFLLDGLTGEERERCLAMATDERCYQKGDVVCDAGCATRALVLVLSGGVRVYHGRVVMNDLEAGCVFGVAALFGEEEPYPTTVVAAAQTRVLFVPQETVTAWVTAYPRVALNYIAFLSGRVRFLNRRLSTLTAGQTDGKLWCYLTANREPDGCVHLPGGMATLAKTLGMGRSSLYRSLDALVADGRVVRRGKNTLFVETETNEI